MSQAQLKIQAESDAGDISNIGSHLSNIQGNILNGFNKDFQAFLFLQLTDQVQARTWLTSIIDEIATGEEILTFNTLFKAMLNRRNGREGLLKATWMNIAFTYEGLQALGVAQADLGSFPDDFKQGMKKRAALIGDIGENTPDLWAEPFRSAPLHAMLLIAADTLADLHQEIAHQVAQCTSGVSLLFIQEGGTRPEQPGHEHFGFKDGISQPGIRGVTPANPQDATQGQPGQDLLWPGEFVLGYPTQPGLAAADPQASGPLSISGPAWTADSSYLVFRRLRQDVKGFRAFIATQAAIQGISEDVMAAKLIGRYKSGAPLERTKDATATLDPTQGDPSLHDASLLDEHINNFAFDGDPDGLIVPRAAHIRKIYPRNQPTSDGDFDVAKSAADTQTHRLIRRGIPFGASYQPDAPTGTPTAGDASFPDDRGLLFLAYQHSIAEHFEFMQRRWAHDENFPRPGDGQDPLLAQLRPDSSFHLPDGHQGHTILLQRWVTMTGGAYFLQPSISALRLLAGGSNT